MNITETIQQDVEQLTEWIQNDPYHKDCLDPLWWLTGNGLLSFCVSDSEGPTMYARMDKDGELLRMHCQFAPESEVSKIRSAKSLIWAVPIMEHYAKEQGLKGLVYKSVSEPLISFMQRQFAFVPTGNDDYIKTFEVD
ncbi:Uncharacterised protein [uncultured archaeon]|nr:Uncharacterised protein [uncultured archaeon]